MEGAYGAMNASHVKFPEPIDEVLAEISEQYDKTKAQVIRNYVEEGLEEDGYLDHLSDNVRENLREKADGVEAEEEEDE